MKRHYITFVTVFISILTALIVGLSIFSQQLLRKNSDKLDQTIDTAVKYIESSNWKKAGSDLEEAEKNWSDVKGTWSALIDHAEIDNIDVTFSRLRMFVQSKELPGSLSEAAALKTFIGHIPEKEKLRLQNLF